MSLDSGPSLIWETRSIGWWADPEAAKAIADEATGLEEIKASFQAWTDVDCSDIVLPFLGTKVGMKAEYEQNIENVNAVIMVKSGWAYDPDAIAVTTNAYDRLTGVVVDADIEINDQEFNFQIVDANNCGPNNQQMDLRNALTHEVGHVLGLDHPPVTPRYSEATMYASAPPCETKKRSLAQDDRDGICTIYPAGQSTMQCFPPDGPSFIKTDSDDGFGCRSTQGTAPWALLLAVLFFVRARRA